jgi:hypothetical protein
MALSTYLSTGTLRLDVSLTDQPWSTNYWNPFLVHGIWQNIPTPPIRCPVVWSSLKWIVKIGEQERWSCLRGVFSRLYGGLAT